MLGNSGYSTPPYRPGRTPRLPTGSTHTALQQQVAKLAKIRHFREVADVHGWDKSQRALQLVSYLDETAMNVAHELGDDALYDYDILVKLLSDRFDPASLVSASRSGFHGRSWRPHEDADSFADAIMELCLSAIHRARRSSARSGSVNSSCGDCRILNSRNTCGWLFEPRRTGNCRH